MPYLTLLRHGESIWNRDNRFTGWTNVGLTENGVNEAKYAGLLLKENNIPYDIAFTSYLERAIKTLDFCYKESNEKKIKTKSHWRLNERHYGALQGLNKSETAKKYGETQVLKWRRSYDIAPPGLKDNDQRHPKFDNLYSNLEQSKLPDSESLKDVVRRIEPFLDKYLVPKIKANKNILIVAHGNSLRALIKIIEKIREEKIIKLNLPTGFPLVYELSKELIISKKYYLGNEDQIQKRINNVLNQGKT